VRALEDFKDNRITALVATEVAARGLDIKELPHVVNYELPNVPEDYVHRIGRTARAGSTGAAVSLVSPDEVSLLRDIEKLLKRSVEFAPTPQFEIKEGSHVPRAESAEAGEYQPHQDPRRRPEHRRPREQRPHAQRGRHGSGRQGGTRAPGTATHDSYLGEPRGSSSAGQGNEQRPRHAHGQGQRSQGRPHHGESRGGQRQGGHGGTHAGQGQKRGDRRGGFARGARSAGGRGTGGSRGGSSGGFSRIS
jgi:ATP-dependent RNA helicase RhlE